MTIGYPDYGGVQLIKSPQRITSSSGVIGANGGQAAFGPFPAVGISYIITADCTLGIGSTIPFFSVDIEEFNTAGGLVERVTADLPMGVNQFDNFYALRGPLSVNQVEIVITNNDTVACSYDMTADASNIVRASHTVDTLSFKSVGSGLSRAPNGNPKKGVLGTWYQNPVGAGVTVGFIVPPAPGPVSIGVRADSATNDVEITAAPYISENNFGGLAQGNLLAGRTDANGNFMTTMNFPRSAMAFNIQNKGAAAQGISTTLVYDVTSG